MRIELAKKDLLFLPKVGDRLESAAGPLFVHEIQRDRVVCVTDQKAVADEATAELAACKFCGETEQLYPGFTMSDMSFSIDVHCLGCGVLVTPPQGVDARKFWNRSASDSAAQEKETKWQDQ